jgi:glutamine cyclotransferase
MDKKINMRHYRIFIAAFLSVIVLQSCRNNTKNTDPAGTAQTSAIPAIGYYVKDSFPHDPSLFTEGFLVHNGTLFESTGSPVEFPDTRSVVGISDLKTGKLEVKAELDRLIYFGEGIVILKNKLYQLTYKNQTGFIYDLSTFKKLGDFHYANAEGWALTTDGKNLIMSDGTDRLTYLDPDNLQPVKTLAVTENGVPRDNLNELEFIKGYIYANIWTTNFIVRIDPADGKVVGKLDLAAVKQVQLNKNPGAQEMNGIAYDAAADKIYITGKMWANSYEIEFKK